MNNPQTAQKENGSVSVMENEHVDTQTGEIITLPGNNAAVAALNSEIESQIATARRYPRKFSAFRQAVQEMATLNEAVADECIYAVPRGGKTIEGPSVRFAEIVLSAWGNCRVSGGVVNEGDKSLTARGVFHDLQSNAAIAVEVPRRITDKNGRRYNDDMISVTGAAAVSIAIRNAVLRGVPKALWADLYDEARKVVAGDFKTLANRRAAALKAFLIYGVEPSQIFAMLGVRAEEDISLDNLVTLRGVLNALKEGATTPEEAFPTDKPKGERPEKDATTGEAKPKTARKKKDEPKPEPTPSTTKAAEGAAGDPPPSNDGAAPGGAAEQSPAATALAEAEAEAKNVSKIDDGPGTPLRRFLDALKNAKVDEIGGMRAIARQELTPSELAVWQGEALAVEARLAKK